MKTFYSLGVMTGTSCDGADFALLRLRYDKRKVVETVEFTASAPFPKKLRAKLLIAQKGKLNLQEYGRLNQEYSLWLAQTCNKVIRMSGVQKKTLIISAHGQTLWHEPPNSKNKLGFSIQMIDAALISIVTGCTTLTGFRQADLARYGEGAPLVPTYLREKTKETGLLNKNIISIHNIGGISNLALLTSATEKVVAFDTGPGNCLIDIAVANFTHGKKLYDAGGSIARSAADKIDWDKIRKLSKHPYFSRKPPKSTGRELFDTSFLKKFRSTNQTLVAETTALTAYTMAAAYSNFGKKCSKIYFYGGGSKNEFLLDLFIYIMKNEFNLSPQILVLPETFASAEYIESTAFARFGFNTLIEKPVSLAAITGAKKDSVEASIFPGLNFKHLLKLV